MEKRTLIRCGFLYQNNGLPNDNVQGFKKGDFGILIRDENFEDVGIFSELSNSFPNAEVIGDQDRIAIPGFCDAHQHGRGVSMLLRGVVDDQFEIWRSQFRWMLPVNRYWDTLYSDLNMLRSGVTSTVHFFYPGNNSNYISELNQVITAHKHSGLRTQIVLGWKDISSLTYLERGEFSRLYGGNFLAEEINELYPIVIEDKNDNNYFKDIVDCTFQENSNFSSLISFSLGPVAPHWCTDALLQLISSLSMKTGWGVHTHLLETIYQKKLSTLNNKKPFTERLYDAGLMKDGTSLVHCVWLTDSDIELIKSNNVGIVFNPSSNLRLREGISPIAKILHSNIYTGLGSDSLCFTEDYDFFSEIRLLHMLSHTPGVGDPFSAQLLALRIVIPNDQFPIKDFRGIGQIVPGYKADLILIDQNILIGKLSKLLRTTIPNFNLDDIFIQRGAPSSVTHVIVNGKMIFKEKQFLAINEDEILENLIDVNNSKKGSVETNRDLLIKRLLTRFLMDIK